MSHRQNLPSESDIVIVGGGVMGTSIAYFLSTESDMDVTLLEKDHIGSGSTGDSSAILRHHYGDKSMYSRMAWWSHEFYKTFEEKVDEPLAHNDNPLVRFASSNSETARYLEQGFDVLSSLGIPVSRYGSEELAKIYPMFYDIERFDMAISDDAAGYSDGTDAATGFARAARRNGVSVLTGIGVESIQETNGSINGVTTHIGPIECDAIVIAAGPWSKDLAKDVQVNLPITPTREQVVILDPPEEYNQSFLEQTPTTSGPDGDWYIRPDFGNGLLLATHHTGATVDPDDYDMQPDEETLLNLSNELSQAIPDLDQSKIKGQYCGVYSTTPDHDFILDHVGPEGCFVACGFSGHGFKHAPAVGRMMTELINNDEIDMVDGEYFSLQRFADNPNGHGKPTDKV